MALLCALAVPLAGCTADSAGPGEPGPTTTPSPSAEPPATADPPASPDPTAGPTAPTSPEPSPTDAADPCRVAAVTPTIDAALAAAGLAPATAWSVDVVDDGLAARTTTGATFADRLGLDCGVRLAEDVGEGAAQRLLLVAWTGPRMAWVLQTSEAPARPYAPEATVTVLVDVIEGEHLDPDRRSVWAGTASDGVTFVIGHVDFSLGAAAKGWLREDPPVDDVDAELAAERHAIRALRAAGMREVGIAEPAQVGSEEGHVMFVSPTGQISVADVAPTGWFDPMVPRYLDGPTRVETIDGASVRITELPPDDDAPGAAVEVGFACDDHDWLLQPPLNGTAEEAVASATAVLATPECRAG